MRLKVIGSSSAGNCFLLENEIGNEALVIEAGVSIRSLKSILCYQWNKVVGCVVSHVHQDHSKHIVDIVKSGIPVLAPKSVWDAKGKGNHNEITAQIGKGYKMGNFRIAPFAVEHDVECYGYLFDHSEMGRLLFLTDCGECDIVFPHLNHIMVECNYSFDELQKAIQEGRTKVEQRERLINSHMELSTCKSFLKAQDLTAVETITLLHLSNNNSNEKSFVEEISRLTGRIVNVAKYGLCLEL